MKPRFLIAYYLGILFFFEGQLFFLPQALCLSLHPATRAEPGRPVSLLAQTHRDGQSVASVGVTVQWRGTFHSSSVPSWLHASGWAQVCEEREVRGTRKRERESAQQG